MPERAMSTLTHAGIEVYDLPYSEQHLLQGSVERNLIESRLLVWRRSIRPTAPLSSRTTGSKFVGSGSTAAPIWRRHRLSLPRNLAIRTERDKSCRHC